MIKKSETELLNRTINRGNIFWVVPDETQGEIPGVPHPHVVVQDDVFNHSRISTIVVCALSSNINRAAEPGVILLDLGEGGLPKHSVVISSQILAIDKSRLGEFIGSLSSDRVDSIVSALRFLQLSFQR